MNRIGIYKIQSVSHPERIYIGSAVDLKRRWSRHKCDLRKNQHYSPKLQNHYNKYGEEDIVFTILTECSKDRLRIKEQCYINVFQPWFNCCRYVSNLTEINEFGRTEEHKHKIAIAQTGENNSFFGKTHTEESNDARRQWNLDHGVVPPGYHGGSKKGRIYKKKTRTCQV